MNATRNATTRTLALGAVLALAGAAAANDTWSIRMNVDNQFDAYVGTSAQTAGSAVGSGNNWTVTYNFTLNNMQASDYFYVVTASDHRGAQGFLGEFTNITQGFQFNTGSPSWEVFPVGAYLQLIDSSWPSSWPSLLQPTQGQVDQALAYGAANPSVWVAPAEFLNWDNRQSGNITTWGHRPGVDATAEWIWNNARGSGNPFNPGYNHDEFLIFRVPGVPAPGSVALLGLGGALAIRRRRA